MYTFNMQKSEIISYTNLHNPDLVIRNSQLFKADKKDAGSPGIMEAMNVPYRNENMEAMNVEVEELEKHGTWEVMKCSDIKKVRKKDGSF